MAHFSIPRSNTPCPRTYWVLDGMLLAGAFAGKPDPQDQIVRLSRLLDAGIRTFINLMEEDERNPQGMLFAPYDGVLNEIASRFEDPVECLRFPIRDRHITTHERMTSILDAIDSSIQRNRPVYVHCFGGIGRTGTVVSCWLLKHGHATEENVFHVLSELRQADTERSWREAPENDTQKRFVLNWFQEREQPKTKPPSTVILRDDWFTKLTGFSERSPDEVRQNIDVQGTRLSSRVNGASYRCGQLQIVSLGALRKQVAPMDAQEKKLKISGIVGDAKALHADASNAGAFFQVASQFNLLEMISPDVTPEQGVGIYERDPTQGPACAVACGAGTIYRNYMVDLDGQIGQTRARQVDCLEGIGRVLGNADRRLWRMQNGYALPTAEGLKEVDSKLGKMTETQLDELRCELKIGVQWDTQVTLEGCGHRVTQAYCSALPVAYSGLSSRLWERFARLILQAAYEATFAAALVNASKTGNRSVYLTSLGGGAFGNDPDWILDAIRRAAELYRRSDLDVKIVSYRVSNPAVRAMCEEF